MFLDIEVFRDINADRKAWNVDLFPGDFIPNNDAMNRGQPGRPFESFGQITSAQPDPDGMIHYGVVRIENNFLAVLIRNRSEAGRIARVSRVILAARNKNPGRLNINTVESTRIALDYDDPANPADFYNPLQGLPGVLALRTVDAVTGNPVGIANFDADNLGPADRFASVVPPVIAGVNIPTLHVQLLAGQILEQRLRIAERPDGRYYEITSDLLSDAHFSADQVNLSGQLSLRPALVLDNERYLLDTDADGVADPLGNELTRAAAIEEALFRFRRMQNLLTTQANVYEILVTAQTGYGVDENGDGRINWRDDTEFRVTGEKTARTIYER